MKTSIASLLLLMLTTIGLMAQNPGRGTVRGQVADGSGKGLEFVTMMLV